MRVGIDVGGTNTDAVLLDTSKRGSSSVVKWLKVPTSADVETGVKNAIRELLRASKVPTSDIKCVTIGTTHLINAVVGRDASKLQRIGVIRLASNNFTRLTPPFVDLPPELRDIICGHVGFVSGGLNIDATPIGELVEAEVVEQCKILKQKGIRSVVIVGTFSPIDVEYRQEHMVKDVIVGELEGVDVICSADIGRLGILERENAAILNASLLRLGRTFVYSIRRALSSAGLGSASLFLSCNDGTMISVDEALTTPVKVFASGPANSMIGASFILAPEEQGSLAESKDYSDQGDALIVVDIGGSTTDAGVLLKTGYPRQASAYSEIAKVRVNFSMPDVQSIGLGGGSIVKLQDIDGVRVAASVGPESVGLRLTEEALCFGGKTLTATDVVIAAGDTPNFGTRTVKLEGSVIRSAKEIIKQQLEGLVDEIKTKATPLPVALVGGGSILLHESLRGTTEILQNKLAPVANAIGAAVAKLSSTLDLIVPMENGRSSVEDQRILVKSIETATNDCVKKGARRDSVKVIMQDLLSLSYISNKVRVFVQVVGDLDPDALQQNGSTEADHRFVDESLATRDSGILPKSENSVLNDIPDDIAKPYFKATDINTYKLKIINKEWHLSETDLEWLAIGCYILGCAGGGSPYATYLEARELVRSGQTLKIIDIEDLPSDAVLIPVAKMGSPMVSTERPGGPLLEDAMEMMLKYEKLDKVHGLVCVEVGGSNGIRPLILGSSGAYNLPMVDGDFMGRAYPTFEKMTCYVLSGGDINDLLPATLASGDGTNMIMLKSKNTEMVDRAMRAACVEMGCAAGVAFRPMSKEEIKTTGILRTHSLAWRLGRAVRKHQMEQSETSIGESLIAEFGGPESAKIIFEGKITAVENRLIKGHSYGSILIRGCSNPPLPTSSPRVHASESELRISFKNENLIAELTSPEPAPTKILATVPSLITVLDSRSGQALGVPEYRYGLKVLVLVAAPHPYWTGERGLEVGGARAFGLDVEWPGKGRQRWVEGRSVIREFG
ncbi:MAG: hypothetical protein MMC33_003379 [Icmadophila ericetorum]|nr:hypothetical protein [Icmadophila ericetorum]